MPQRAMNIVLAVLGLAVVAGLVIAGADAYASSRRGPRWWRRLVGAGLVVLAMLGVGACATRTSTGAGGGAVSSGGAKGGGTSTASELSASDEWQSVAATWREAEEIASGKRGDYPFDERGKKRVMAALVEAGRDIDALATRALLSDAEAGLLKKDLALLTNGVMEKRPTEMRMAKCHEAMACTPARDSVKRLAARLPLLERLAAQEKLAPEVLSKVLARIEEDVATLDKDSSLRDLPEAERAEAERLRDAARSQLREIRARIEGRKTGTSSTQPPSPLLSSPDWKVITDAWREAAPLAAESAKYTMPQRNVVKVKLAAARDAAGRLAASGLLERAEAELLVTEADRIEKAVYRDPPPGVRCYSMAYLPPARRSLGRLAKRLPLLMALAADGKVTPAALAKVVPSIEADLKTLSTEGELGKLRADERAKAEDTRRAAQKALADVKRLLAAPDGTE